MLDIGWTELLLIGTIALVVVGPKDLPRVLRYVGYWVGKARSMAREFQRAIDQYAKEADLEDVKKAATAPSRAKNAIREAIDPKGALTKSMSDTEASIKDGLKDAGSGGKAKQAVATPSPPATAPEVPAAAVSSGAATPAPTTAVTDDDKPKAQAG
jgi:sec-independent protein translocase protein TatB